MLKYILIKVKLYLLIFIKFHFQILNHVFCHFRNSVIVG